MSSILVFVKAVNSVDLAFSKFRRSGTQVRDDAIERVSHALVQGIIQIQISRHFLDVRHEGFVKHGRVADYHESQGVVRNARNGELLKNMVLLRTASCDF